MSNVSFSVPMGCLFGLIGPGASGKSVLLKLMAGLLRPSAGTVTLGGQKISHLPELDLQVAQKQIGMLFQNNALFDHWTVFDNIAFPLKRLTQLSQSEISDRVHERLRAVSMVGFGDRMPASLSGGQKKRIGVARATVTQAPYTLYDEPAAGLDPVTSQKIFELLREEQLKSKSTVVMVSSDIDRLVTVTDRIGMMVRGELVFEGTTHESLHTEHPYMNQFMHGLLEGPL